MTIETALKNYSLKCLETESKEREYCILVHYDNRIFWNRRMQDPNKDEGLKITMLEDIKREILCWERDKDHLHRAVKIASQDQQRNKEIAAWDKIASKVKDK